MFSPGRKLHLLLIIILFTASSCTRHLYHLNFAKTEKTKVPEIATQQKTESDESATASIEEPGNAEELITADKPAAKAIANEMKVFKEVFTSPKNSGKALVSQLQDLKEQVTSLSSEKKSSALSSRATYPILKNEDKLLVLWVSCVGGAILFWVAGSYVEPLTFIGAFLGASAFIFFIFWLVAIAL